VVVVHTVVVTAVEVLAVVVVGSTSWS
jgi:hypothetical protein